MNQTQNPPWPNNASVAAKRRRVDASPQPAEAKRPRLAEAFPDDIDFTLEEIRLNYGISIMEMIKKIQKTRVCRHENTDFIRRLKCLRLVKLGNTVKFKTDQIEDLNATKCVIVSWSWEASKYESEQAGSCFIDNRSKPSKVRNCVWRRAAAYMQYMRVDYLWIDRECINQKDPEKKDKAMRQMDLLYHLGKHPLGLLTRPIDDKDDLLLLAQILRRDMLNSKLSGDMNEVSLKEGATDRAWEGIKLLLDIISDTWWKRAWIFQEHYRGGERMDLLMPHNSDLERLKLEHEELFGNLAGELIISSIRFSKTLTDLCSAFIRSTPTGPKAEVAQGILSTAGRYSALLEKGSSMSPRVIADVRSRDVTHHPDRLDIFANCCSYNVRLDKQVLVKERFSHSLAILVSFLLNGEIFKFEPDKSLEETVAPCDLTVIQFIHRYAFDRFSPPFQGRGLTFNRSCRFSWVDIKADGVHTSGQLWQVCKRKIKIKPHQVEGLDTIDTLRALQRYIKRAEWTINIDRWYQLASRLEEFLEPSSDSAAKRYMWKMAEKLVEALREGITLRLGYLCNSQENTEFSPPTAILICPDQAMDRNGSAYVLTSSRGRTTSDGPGYICDVDKHVSLQVDFSNKSSWDRNKIWGLLPELKARAWMHGLWFWTEDPQEVVFPLPAVLSELSGPSPEEPLRQLGGSPSCPITIT